MDTPHASQTESHENSVRNSKLEPPPLLTTPCAPRPSFEVVHTTGREDLATVFVVRFPHGNVCEMVDAVDPRYPKTDKWILNLSTQFGCPVGCPYCDAGGGYRGDVSAKEMLAMVHHLVARNEEGLAQRCKKLKVHFSRMGEPALNDAVLEVLPRLREWLSGPDVWVCIATTAPRRRHRWFHALTRLKNALFPRRFQLQLSLNSTDEAARRRLVPMDHLSLGELASLGERFYSTGDRKIGLNFALARDVPFQAETIKRWFDPSVFCVKLTPVNPTERGRENGVETVLRSEREEALEESMRDLRGWGYDVVLSVGDAGEDEIGSNCGQAVRFLATKQSETS